MPVVHDQPLAAPDPSDDGAREALLTVVGLGARGWQDADGEARTVLASADVLVGADRLLATVPDVAGQRRLGWPSPLREGLPRLLEAASGQRVVALASGDPFVSGIGTTLVDLLGPGRVEVLPAVSSLALARAELGWSAESCAVVSVVGRAAERVLRELAPGRRVLVLSSDETTPDSVAALLVRAGYGQSAMHVLGDLGSPEQTRADTTAQHWSGPGPRLHVIGLELAGPLHVGWATGLPDDAYEHDGQLTKRDLRASALARLSPVPGALLWDVGAGAGSIGIEWMRAHPTCRAVAVEAHPERAARIARNAAALGVPDLEVVEGRAPDDLAGLAVPDAIFVGGGASAPGVLDRCLDALGPGGRLVVHGVTLETERELATRYAALGGELVRVAVESAAPIGSFTGWTPQRAVTQWSYCVPADGGSGDPRRSRAGSYR
ncbi:bifunctional cobalt-precorrin-7 (C(5))-methyltransferase/cobalt-precorrin-6B (C(15))-methyltransferase [Marihabitans asiaticum]|uniref:Precorrin-6Y C5,15-methyltransferase (Decarboxylating) n=1 Tax=Marihabitans asiaticum TaxID=415218 RepID=A0A560WGG2_9MICO|nr:precorrin-6Y C5,15-methyltransferase (decarboxylating) [Marihabitans asiaticum]